MASLVLIMVTLNIGKGVTNSHLKNHGSYTKELLKTFDDVLWEHVSSDDYQTALKIWSVWHDYETRQSFQGMGDVLQRR